MGEASTGRANKRGLGTRKRGVIPIEFPIGRIENYLPHLITGGYEACQFLKERAGGEETHRPITASIALHGDISWS